MLWERQTATLNFVPTKLHRRRWKRWDRSSVFWSRPLDLLKAIEAHGRNLRDERKNSNRRFWLLPYRRAIRRIFYGVDRRFNEGQLDLLRFYLSTCPREMIPICIWLISHCTDRFHLCELKLFCFDPNPRIRKHLAKALRRLEAWSLLAEMAAAYPGNEAIQWFAKTPTTHRPFRERMSDYLKRVDDSHATEAAGPSRMPYWSLYTPWQGRPAKSAWFIRQILWRIRRWVRGT
jgi:hypothetical protein